MAETCQGSSCKQNASPIGVINQSSRTKIIQIERKDAKSVMFRLYVNSMASHILSQESPTLRESDELIL